MIKNIFQDRAPANCRGGRGLSILVSWPNSQGLLLADTALALRFGTACLEILCLFTAVTVDGASGNPDPHSR